VTPSEPWLARLEAVAGRLDTHAAGPRPGGLTAADPASGERWEAAQVWAHLTEFPGYWVAEVRHILAAPPDVGPVPFGRTKTDPGRVAAIARDRDLDPAEARRRILRGIAAIEEVLRGMTGADWARTGRHPTLGVMGMDRIMREFLVGHLEEHATQLDDLAHP
jgi:hypothetical protein